MTFLKQKKILIFLLLCTILFFQGILKLPVMDRDEARFATATKTMIETKDFETVTDTDETDCAKSTQNFQAESGGIFTSKRGNIISNIDGLSVSREKIASATTLQK